MPSPFFGALLRGAVSVSLSCLLAFPELAGAAPLQAPPPAKPTGAQSPFEMTGCLINVNGHLLLRDPVSGMTEEVLGVGIETEAGNTIEVSAVLVPGAQPVSGAREVIRVSRFRRIARNCGPSAPQAALGSQTPARSPGMSGANTSALNIVIVEGDGAINNVRQRTARETIVQVEDENHKPVAGAAVVFLLPGNGPGGVWANGARTLQVTTDSQGRAAAKGLRPNNQSGKFQIQVEATYQGLTATTAVTQVNAVITGAAAGGGGLSAAKLIAILAVAGGAVAAGAVLATRGGGTSTPSATITPGAPGVGAP